ncbi:NAD(P)H-dependent glycerol-3-phosphate dehydrogenase [Methylosoma difficile]
MEKKLTILGAGSWGTALAILAARNGCQTMLWGHNPEHVQALQQTRENRRYLLSHAFPSNLQITDQLSEAGAFSDLLLVSVPSHAFKTSLQQIKPYLNDGCKIAWASKGFNPSDGCLLHEIVADLFGEKTPAAILSGPSFAKEVAADLPTAITIASTQNEFAAELAEILHSSRFRTYTSTDVIGVEVGGAVKNVLAIAAGIADGLGFGANTRAALITRGLNEIIRLGIKLGGKQETFMGLAGLGDLVLTCTDDQSRNRRFGIALGKGENREQAMLKIGQEIEGFSAAKETYLLAQKLGLEMPITEQTYKVLYEGLAPQIAVENLLARNLKAES